MAIYLGLFRIAYVEAEPLLAIVLINAFVGQFWSATNEDIRIRNLSIGRAALAAIGALIVADVYGVGALVLTWLIRLGTQK